MIAIKEFIQQIIYVAIITIIIELILPKGNTKKYIYIILSIFILLNIISPVINIIKNRDVQTIYDDILATISFDKIKNDDIDVTVFSEYKNEKIRESLNIEVSKQIETMLNNMNVIVKNIDLEITDEYTFENLEITVGNLEHLGEAKNKKISDIITALEKEYELSNNVIKIIEEGE